VRPLLYEGYFFLVEYGNLPLETIWKMPVAVRRWWSDKLIEKYERQKQAMESQSGRKQHTPDSFKKMHEQIRSMDEGNLNE
jgi:hypothetical protein